MKALLLAAITVVALALAGCGGAYGSSGGSHTTHSPAATSRPGY